MADNQQDIVTVEEARRQPLSFAETCVQQFDDLVSRGELFYSESVPEYVNDESGFKIQFRYVKAFEKKPWPGREIANPTHRSDPFGDPQSCMVVTEIPGYVLQLNKYCAVKPQFLLHPKTFASQDDRLNLGDFESTLHFMQKLVPMETLAFYNCGKASGSSQPFKHVQLMVKPAADEIVLWPDQPDMKVLLDSEEGSVPLAPLAELGVPYLSRVIRVAGLDAFETEKAYVELLVLLEKETGHPVKDHNLLFTKDWMCVVPRVFKSTNGSLGCSSVSMMGLIWLSYEGEREEWERQGYGRYMGKLGYTS